MGPLQVSARRARARRARRCTAPVPCCNCLPARTCRWFDAPTPRQGDSEPAHRSTRHVQLPQPIPAAAASLHSVCGSTASSRGLCPPHARHAQMCTVLVPLCRYQPARTCKYCVEPWTLTPEPLASCRSRAHRVRRCTVLAPLCRYQLARTCRYCDGPWARAQEHQASYQFRALRVRRCIGQEPPGKCQPPKICRPCAALRVRRCARLPGAS
mmetsp:Transcript_102450/g.265382  ORF Transcript_102450/g.265382 Transcript_102450/m.265382 type:complete len:212 (-) Transcript_102450:761-1396(-)